MMLLLLPKMLVSVSVSGCTRPISIPPEPLWNGRLQLGYVGEMAAGCEATASASTSATGIGIGQGRLSANTYLMS